MGGERMLSRPRPLPGSVAIFPSGNASSHSGRAFSDAALSEFIFDGHQHVGEDQQDNFIFNGSQLQDRRQGVLVRCGLQRHQ